jgi:rRNA maturation endonuclease Nob1
LAADSYSNPPTHSLSVKHALRGETMKHKGIWHNCEKGNGKIFEDEQTQECTSCGKTWSKAPKRAANGEARQDRVQPKS